MKLIKEHKEVILITLCLASFLSFLFYNVVFATGLELNTNKFEPGNESVPKEITDIGGTVYNTLITIGVILAVIVLIVIGIKYILGSVEEKAEYKKTLFPYLLGAILIFSGGVIIKIIQEFVR